MKNYFKLNTLLNNKGAFLFIFLIVLVYQNCSVVNFDRDYNQVELSSTTTYYVNTRFITIDINTDKNIYTKMRASTKSDLSSLTWFQTTNVLTFDLAEEYSSDGSKDGEKKYI